MTIYGRSEELVSRCIECDLAEPESLTSLGGSAPGLVDGILSILLPTNSRIFCGKLFATKIHRESHPVSTCIPAMYLTTWYFHANFHVNTLLAKLPSTST